MSENTFFFRDSYSISEKEERVSAPDFRSEDEPLVQSVLDEAEMNMEDLIEQSKDSFLAQIKTNIEENRYEKFIDEMFDKYGEKGDRINVQFYQVSNCDMEKLSSTLPEKINEFSESDLSILSYLVELNDYYINREKGQVTMEFLIRDHKEVIDVEGSDIIRDPETGERIKLSETDLNDVEYIYKDKSYPIEARVSTETELVSMTRSKGKESTRKQILSLIKRWGGN